MGKIKKIIRRIVLGEKADSDSFVEYLRKQGVSVGEGVRFFSPRNTLVDISAPWLISIGNNVNITHGVIIITHDYAWSVIKQLPECKGRVNGAQQAVTIGNNVFIGMNSIITRGVTVGDNVVIGAGSVVVKDCESDSVYAGNPAKKIMSIQEYAAKRQHLQYEEAKALAIYYKEKFKKEPPIEIFSEYFTLFCTVEQALKIPCFLYKIKTGGNCDDAISYINNTPPMFNGYSEFLYSCFRG